MSNHASQVMTHSSKTFEEILNQRKLKFTLHPEKPLMVTIGYDNDLVFWNTLTHSSIYSDTLAQTPSCIRFSPDGRLLVTGFENGLVQLCTIGEEKDKKSKRQAASTIRNKGTEKPKIDEIKTLGDKKSSTEKDGLAAIIYKVEQSISEPQTHVLNLVFSPKGTFMAISYLNKKDPEDGEEKVTGIVQIYKMNEEIQKKDTKEKLYYKWQTIPSTVCSNLVPAVMHGCYFMTFSLDENYLFLNFQQFDRYNLRVNDDKERNYVVWHIEKGQKQDNIDMISDTEIGSLLFPNHVNGLYKYHEKYLEKSKQQDK